MNCAFVAVNAGGLAALPSNDAERSQAYAHAVACPGCAASLREAESIFALLGVHAAPARPDAATMARVRADLARSIAAESPSNAWVMLPAALALAAGVLPLATQVSLGLTTRLAVALASAFAAAVLLGVSLVGPSALFVLLPAMSAVMAAAWGGGGPVDAHTGLHCLGVELAMAAPALGAAVWLVRRGALTRPRLSLAAASAAGALAAQAAVSIKCEAVASHAHNFGFHASAVLVAAALGYLISRSPWVSAPQAAKPPLSA